MDWNQGYCAYGITLCYCTPDSKPPEADARVLISAEWAVTPSDLSVIAMTTDH